MDNEIFEPNEDFDFEQQPDFSENGRDLWEHFHFVVDKGQVLLRIDKYLTTRVPNTSRNRIQNAAEAECIRVNGKVVKSNYRVKPGDDIRIVMDRPRYENEIIPEVIPLDIVCEADERLVVTKPAGLAGARALAEWGVGGLGAGGKDAGLGVGSKQQCRRVG